ncbi:MAG: hypothetical protein ABFD94_02860 [Armatimonadia bacterium]
MKLQQHETRSALWLKLQAHMSEQLDVLRRKNDGLLSHEDTQRLRGRIAQLKEILALSETEPVQVGATDDATPGTNDHRVVGFSQEQV